MRNELDSLQHFGIFGMHWGIRRFQNEDGTLTEEGKKRYGRKDIEKSIDESIVRHPEAYERVRKNGELIPKMTEDLANKFNKHFSKVKFSEETKEKIWNDLHKEFGAVGTDDPELFELTLQEYSSKYMDATIPKSLKQEKAKFDRFMNGYFDDVHEIANEVVDKYKDTKIDTSDAPSMYGTGELFIRNLVGEKLNTSYNAYVSRHFDDFIYDDDYWNGWLRATKEFTYENYDKRFVK